MRRRGSQGLFSTILHRVPLHDPVRLTFLAASRRTRTPRTVEAPTRRREATAPADHPQDGSAARTRAGSRRRVRSGFFRIPII